VEASGRREVSELTWASWQDTSAHQLRGGEEGCGSEVQLEQAHLETESEADKEVCANEEGVGSSPTHQDVTEPLAKSANGGRLRL
jgi:hypothetical protein